MNDPNLRAVPNPEPNETRELIKTVVLTSAVSSLVGVFAVAGGQALFSWIKKAASKKEVKPTAAAPRAVPPGNDYFYGAEYDDVDPIPESLRMRPGLRHTGPRRRRPGAAPADNSEIRRMFEEFETRQGERLDRIERRIDESYEEEEEDTG